MKLLLSLILVSGTIVAAEASGAPPPFVLERTIVMPAVPPGPYSDYLSIDLERKYLFATPQASKSVAVLDLNSGSVVRMIPGFGNSHGIFFSPQTHRLYVADSEVGDVKVFDGEKFELTADIAVAKGADWMTHDEKGTTLFVNDGGEDAGMDHSEVSIIDASSLKKVGAIPIKTAGLEASAYDADTGRIYVNAPDDHAVAVLDVRTRQVVQMWSIGKSHQNMTMTIDRVNDRLYIGCRDTPMHGSLVVLDRRTGKLIATLPLDGWVDSTQFDERRQAIYASAGVGHLETYTITGKDNYNRLPVIDTAVMAKTSLYSPELDRMYVSVPHLGSLPAQIMVFRPQLPVH